MNFQKSALEIIGGEEERKRKAEVFFFRTTISQTNGPAHDFAQRPALHAFEGDQIFPTPKYAFGDIDF